MIIFKDKLTDDEMISDSYDLKEIDGIAYEADCAMIEEGVGDIGRLFPVSTPNYMGRNQSAADQGRVRTDIGGNASAEEAADDLADDKVKVNNVVASFRLQSTQFDKKGFLSYLKGTKPTAYPILAVCSSRRGNMKDRAR